MYSAFKLEGLNVNIAKTKPRTTMKVYVSMKTADKGV